MTDKQKENLKLAIKNLRANNNKAKEQMCDDSGGRCCLCVMSDTAEDIMGVMRESLREDDFYPKIDLAEIYGIPSSKVSFFDPIMVGEFNFVAFNDGFYTKSETLHQGFKEYSHQEIADIIEETFLK